jgi:hypothetical protein
MAMNMKKPAIPKKHNKDRRKIAQFQPFALDTIPEARATWAQVIRDYEANQRSSAKSRDLNSFMKTLLGYMLAEREGRIEERLAALEQKLGLVVARVPRAAS